MKKNTKYLICLCITTFYLLFSCSNVLAGNFLAVTALRNCTVKDVVKNIKNYAISSKLGCHEIKKNTEIGSNDALIFSRENGWVIILWPQYFNLFDIRISRQFSKKLKTTVSTIHIYDGDYWTHVLFDKGIEIDKYASIPDYFVESQNEKSEMRRTWKGNPEIISKYFNIPKAEIEHYFIYNDSKQNLSNKAYAEDEYTLENYWIFIDFWKKIGIIYPNDLDLYSVCIRFGDDFLDKLIPSDEPL